MWYNLSFYESNMKQEYIAEIIAHQEKMMATIHYACTDKLEMCGYAIDALEEKIIAGMRWALLLRNEDGGLKKGQTRINWDAQREYYDKQDLLQVSCAEIFQLQQELKGSIFELPIFSPMIEKYLKDKTISLDFKYQGLQTDIHIKDEQALSCVDDLLVDYKLQLTLPDYDTIFPDCESLMDIPQWMLEYIDTYETFAWDVRQMFQRVEPYVQIGGYGKWIQGSYSDTYIAQVNNDVGDAGSVFLCCSELGKFDAWVDMH